MKTLFLFTLIIVGISVSVPAQKFEHFKVDTLMNGWRLSPTFDYPPKSGVNNMGGDHSNSIVKMVKNAIQTFPKDIKEELSKQDIIVNFLFNEKGEVFYIIFRGKLQEGVPLTDAQWLKVYGIIRNIKIDLTKMLLLDNFEWGDGGTYPISKYLREAGD